MIIKVSDELFKDCAFDMEAFLNAPPGERRNTPPEPTVQDFYDEYASVIADDNTGLEAAFKAGYEIGYDRGAWENA